MARSQVLFITTARTNESKSSQGLFQLPCPSQTLLLKQKNFKGGTQGAMGLGIPQLLPHSSVALLGSAALRESFGAESRCLRPARCSVARSSGFQGIPRTCLEREWRQRWSHHGGKPTGAGWLCHCRVSARKMLHRTKGWVSSKILDCRTL